MSAKDLDAIRESVLDRMEHHERMVRLAIFGAVALEGVLLVVVLLIIDWRDATQKLVFVTSILSYSIVALGLAALGAHVSRTVGRILAAIPPKDAS